MIDGKHLRREQLLERKHELPSVIGGGPAPLIDAEHIEAAHLVVDFVRHRTVHPVAGSDREQVLRDLLRRRIVQRHPQNQSCDTCSLALASSFVGIFG